MPVGGQEGKLKSVAAAWAGGRGGRAQREDDAATQQAILPKWMAPRAEREAIEVSVVDGETIGLFYALDTQWRFHPMSAHRLGIDYQAIRPTAENFGIDLTPQRMVDLREMEAAAMAEFARRSR